MKTQQIPLLATVTAEIARAAVMAAAAAVEGQIALESTLKTIPGSLHWHVRRRGRNGTIEATFWPQKTELWVSVHANRERDWAAEAFSAFADALEERLCRGAE